MNEQERQMLQRQDWPKLLLSQMLAILSAKYNIWFPARRLWMCEANLPLPRLSFSVQNVTCSLWAGQGCWFKRFTTVIKESQNGLQNVACFNIFSSVPVGPNSHQKRSYISSLPQTWLTNSVSSTQGINASRVPAHDHILNAYCPDLSFT